MRAQLKTIEHPKAMEQHIEAAVVLAEGLRTAQEFACVRLNGPAFEREALRIAGKTRAEIEARAQQLDALPMVETWRPLRVFVEAIYNHAIDPHGYAQPPAIHEMPGPHVTRVPAEVFSAACLELGVTKAELSAVACLRAVKEHPEIFARGCDNADAHQKRIAEVQARLRDTLQQAADALDYETDVLYCSGTATFALSGGAVHIGDGRGDASATERLLAWCLANREAA